MNEFAIANVLPGKLNALVKNIMRQTGVDDPNEAVRLVNSGEWIVTKPVRIWCEKDNVIEFPLITNGFTGPEWIEYYDSNGFDLSDDAKCILLSDDFKPTKKGTRVQVGVLKGAFFKDSDRFTNNIRTEAARRNWMKPNAEIACLIRKMFTNEETEAMGLTWIITMHEPIENSDGDPLLLGALRHADGDWLGAYRGLLDDRWVRGNGFAFAVAQVCSQD